MPSLYNPLDKFNLGKSVLDALLEQHPQSLAELLPFRGAGIYAIYYHGSFDAYKPVSINPNEASAKPIYVGKAIPTGSRKGASLISTTGGQALWKRLSDHKDTIFSVEKAAGNLRLADFSVRYLVVDDIWIPLGESLLIATFSPLWNTVVDGFGNHDPGAGRYNGLRPIWDVLHPGRVWADRCKVRPQNIADITQSIVRYFASNGR